MARGVHGGGGMRGGRGCMAGGCMVGACMAGGQAWQRLCVAGGHPPAGTTRYGIHPCSECYCIFIHNNNNNNNNLFLLNGQFTFFMHNDCDASSFLLF